VNVRSARLAWRICTLVALVSFLVAAWDLAFGGFRFAVFGVRISSWELYRPVVVGTLFAAAAFGLRVQFSGSASSWTAPDFVWQLTACGLTIAFAAVAISFGTFVAGGADGYGYVSESQLLRSGRISDADPLVSLAQQIGPAVAPIGYRLSPRGDRIIPTYPPGLPIAMAAGALLAGDKGTYLVVPVLSGVAILLTFVLGCRLADARTALTAAAFLAMSPLFLFHALVPMSDVPATAWWLLAWVFAVGDTDATAVCAGLAAAAALLTRPNLVPLAGALGGIIVLDSGLRRAALFGLGVVPGCLAIADIHQTLYGSPFESGYGTIGSLFRFSNVVPNIVNYGRSFTQLHSPFALIALAAPFVGRIRLAWSMLAFCAMVFACYAFYAPFEYWTFSRFLLPALPLICLLCSSVIVRAIDDFSSAVRTAALSVICILLAYVSILKSTELGVFDIKRAEQRYAIVGTQVDRFLPDDAVVLSVNHSGSIRLYGQRATMRWDLIAPDRLDATLDVLKDHGYVPFLALDEYEEDVFRNRFSKGSRFGRLDWPPRIEYPGPTRVRIFRLADRDAGLDGPLPPPIVIPPS
jgi:hypothetical protein